MNKPKIIVPEISFDSEVFKDAKSMLDGALLGVLTQVFKGQFESGDINLKISISLVDDYEKLPGDDPITGETIETMYEYRRPEIESTVSTSLKKVAKGKASYSPQAEIKEMDGAFVIQELPKVQITMDKLDDFEY